MAFNEKGQWVNETAAPVTPWRQGYQAPNVPAPAPIADSVPVREAGGNIVPAPDTSGLYAIYGRKNTAADKADRYSRMAGMDMGGKLGQLPGIVAAFKAGRAEKQAAAFEKQKESDVKDFMARREAYDKIKNKREDIDFNAQMTEKALGAGQDAYFGALSSGGDYEAAAKLGSEAINTYAKDNGVMMPPVKNVHFWKGGDASLASSKEGGGTITLVKKGDIYAWNDKGTMRPVPKDAMGFGDMARMASATRDRSGPNPNGMLEFYDANGNLVAKTKNQAEAIQGGAVSFGQWYKTEDEQGNSVWQVRKVPLSKAQIPRPVGDLSNAAPGGQPPPPAAAQNAALMYGRPNPVPGSPGSGQQPAPAAQPAAQPAPQFKSAEEVRAAFNSGKLNAVEAKKILAESFGMR